MEQKKTADASPAPAKAGGLGDGERLETNATNPDYVNLALTSRVYDIVAETPLQHAGGLSQKLGASVHVKREDLLPSFSSKLRGTYNMLAHAEHRTEEVITYSVGSQGHSAAVRTHSARSSVR